jgi:hypothetical protein
MTSAVPKVLWDYKLFDPKADRSQYILCKSKHHVESRLEKCKEILIHAFQGDLRAVSEIGADLASMRGFMARCKQVRHFYQLDTDAADERLKGMLEEACGKCWCVQPLNGEKQVPVMQPLKKRKPSYEYVIEEKKPAKKKKKKAKKETQPLAQDDEIPEAATMWLSNKLPPIDWKRERKLLIDLIKETKRVNEGLPVLQRQNWASWRIDPIWRETDYEGLLKFLDEFIAKNYRFMDERVGWDHCDPNLQVLPLPPQMDVAPVAV